MGGGGRGMESVDWCMNPVPHTWNCSETYFILSLFVDGVGPKYSPIISAGLGVPPVQTETF